MHPYVFGYFSVLAFLLGGIIGSFLNVVIYRWPRGESLTGRSRCCTCGQTVRAYDNIPVLSYFLLRARCRSCGSRFSLRYPLVELLTAILFLALFFRYGPSPTVFVYALLGAAMIAISIIDLDCMLIPDAISLNLIPVGVASAILGFLPGVPWTHSLAGLFFGVAVLYAPAVIYQKVRGIEGLGGGDIKLLGMIGSFTGPVGVFAVMMVSSLIGSLAGVITMVAGSGDSTTPIPFGPFLAGACVLYILFGPLLIHSFTGLAPQEIVSGIWLSTLMLLDALRHSSLFHWF